LVGLSFALEVVVAGDLAGLLLGLAREVAHGAPVVGCEVLLGQIGETSDGSVIGRVDAHRAAAAMVMIYVWC